MIFGMVSINKFCETWYHFRRTFSVCMNILWLITHARMCAHTHTHTHTHTIWARTEVEGLSLLVIIT